MCEDNACNVSESSTGLNSSSWHCHAFIRFTFHARFRVCFFVFLPSQRPVLAHISAHFHIL